VNDLS